MSRFIAIAGGSGSGKSTLANGLLQRLGDRASLLGLDDYQKTKAEVPRTASGRPNYDHPDAVNFAQFLRHLAALRAGQDLHLTRRHKRLTVDDGVVDGESVVIAARPLVIVEGYLALWHPAARAAYDFAIFLDLPPALRVARRRWAKDPSYVTEVLLPMHDQFIEPTKAHADAVIQVERLDESAVLERAWQLLRAFGVL